MGNRIFVVQGGKVVETGTHDELLERHGSYYAMWNAQQ
jgi:ATP-binding cassette subfamily B protein